MRAGSPLEVPGVGTNLSRDEVVNLVRESRRSTERFFKWTTSKRVQPTRKKQTRGG